jgi:hypothetical protein
MANSPNLTFRYEFAVQRCHLSQSAESISSQDSASRSARQNICWTGGGNGRACSGENEGIVGPRPMFELREGWLTLLPSDGWTQSLPARWFSDAERRQRNPDAAEWLEAQKETLIDMTSRSGQMDLSSPRKTSNDATNAALRRGLKLDLASYSVFVGEALGDVLRIGDKFKFSRDGYGDFCYSVGRSGDTVFSAGSVGRVDDGGPVAVWQEYDSHPNPNAEALKKKLPHMRIAESINVHRPYVSVRVKDQMFQLLDGQEVHIDPYYVFLARSNKNVSAIDFEFTPRAVHSTGCLDTLVGKEQIIDAARQLTAPKTKSFNVS